MTDAAGKPVYAATVHVRLRYGFLGIKRMASPVTARKGIIWAGVGMVLATAVTYLWPGMHNVLLMTIALAIGGALARQRADLVGQSLCPAPGDLRLCAAPPLWPQGDDCRRHPDPGGAGARVGPGGGVRRCLIGARSPAQRCRSA